MSSGADDWPHVYDADSEDEDDEESDNESDQMRQPGGGEHQRPRTTIELATGEDRSGSNEEQNGTDDDSDERMEVERQLLEEEEEVFQAAAALVSIHRNEVAPAANRTERNNKRFQCTFDYCEFETDDFEEIIEHIRLDHFGSRSIVQGREVYDFIAENEQQSGDDEMVVDEDVEVVGEDDESRRWGKQPKDRPPQVTENQSNLIEQQQNESSDSEPSSSSFANYFKAKAEDCQR